MGRYPSTYIHAQRARVKLSEAHARYIHSQQFKSDKELADELGYSPTTIHNVRVGNTWPELHPMYPGQPVPAPAPPPPPSKPAPPDPATIAHLMAQLGG